MRIKHKILADQVVVITGASSGIGLATAYEAAKRGAKVVLSSRNGESLKEIEKKIRASGGEAICVPADVSKREEVEALAAAAIDAYGGFDTWVNNAGLGIFGRLDQVSDEDHRKLFDINFWGIVNGTLVAAKHLKTSGGAIINLGSVVSDVAFPIQGMYCASKHAVKGFTDAFRMELQAENSPISVTLIKPASIDTPFPIHAKNYTDGKPTLPSPVYSPKDVAEAILYAAVHGGRDYYIGGGGKLMSSLNKHLPAAVDWFGSRFVPGASVASGPANRAPASALDSAGDDGEVHGNSPHHVMRSSYSKASTHPVLTSALVASAGIALASLMNRARS